MIVMDSFALPVEGTETRVNAAAEGAAYMIQYLEACEKTNKEEPGLGWYHSVRPQRQTTTTTKTTKTNNTSNNKHACDCARSLTRLIDTASGLRLLAVRH